MAKNLSKQEKINLILKYLNKNRLMALATSNKNKSWSATTFFAYDKEANIYFYSSEKTKHCHNIKSNPNVAAVINHDWKYPSGDIRGLQLIGRAYKISKKEYSKLYSIYRKRFKWADDFKSDHVLYVIKPSEIWYIDEKIFGHFHRVRMV